jgi:hypothetical protein
MRRMLTIMAACAALGTAFVAVPTASGHISNDALKGNALRAAKQACNGDSYCRRYGFHYCDSNYKGGGRCWVYNFQSNPGDGRYTCRTLVFWRHPDSRPKVLKGWNCSQSGWQY